MSGKTVAITGASWFVGKYLVKIFAQNSYKVIAFGRKNIKDFRTFSNIKYIIWDMNYPFQKFTDIPFERIDILIHNASNTNYLESKDKLIKENVESLVNILDFCKKKSIKNLVYISSSSVYQGLSGKLSTDIKINLKNLQNSYSLSKFLAEQFILKNFRWNILIIRPRAIYGKGDNNLIPNILKHQLFWYLFLPGNWKKKTSLTDVFKFVEYIFESVESWKIWIYNFSTDIKTYNQIYSEISKKYNLKGFIKIPCIIIKLLSFFNNNKYSYIFDNFCNDKILLN